MRSRSSLVGLPLGHDQRVCLRRPLYRLFLRRGGQRPTRGLCGDGRIWHLCCCCRLQIATSAGRQGERKARRTQETDTHKYTPPEKTPIVMQRKRACKTGPAS